MKYLILIILILQFNLRLVAQDSLVTKLMLGEKIEKENAIVEFSAVDFSTLWTQTENNNIYGIIGQHHQRIKIKLLTITKKQENLQIYEVNGKSSVDGYVCPFTGSIEIVAVHKLESLHYGIDDEHKEQGIQEQGLIIAEYSFHENKERIHSGTFTGQLYSKWYQNESGEIMYDDIQLQSDGYFNNAHIGTWVSYKTHKSKICNWGDYRVPHCNDDFDIGAAEFSPSKKYFSQGWQNYEKAWSDRNEEAKKTELKEWWK